MRTAFALIAFVVAAVTAQTTPYYITAPIQGTSFKAGSKADIDWINGSSQNITLSLLNGPTAQTQSVILVIASNVNGDVGSYSWTIPTSVGVSTTYAIQIQYGNGNYSYSAPFSVTGGTTTLSYSAVPTTSSMISLASSSIATAMSTAISMAPSSMSSSASASATSAVATKSSGAMQNVSPAWALAIPAVAALFL
ncbi:Ser-Thr-rich glycosyl-phosphatidyl-inositol-anchored membrane family-domain-containing protein [Umbelopsis sp. PMI_123]|nr:Ser-Thr-rich glycosyl-phosphatidyl-inositol-anchored membrane family-domain-containing protein [Umbelopsis sp. PMI_123]